MRYGGARRTALGALLLAALAGCSSIGGDQADTAAQAPTAAAAAGQEPGFESLIKRNCPQIEILQGAESYRVYGTPNSNDPFDIRYQANIADTARECSLLGVEAAIRIGVTGRLIVGPKGAPGSVRLPLRIAVLDDKGTPVYSRIHPITVAIPAGQQHADFPHIEDGVVVPIPANRFIGWKIVIGYDPKGAL